MFRERLEVRGTSKARQVFVLFSSQKGELRDKERDSDPVFGLN